MLLKIAENQSLPIYQFFRGFSLLEYVLFFAFQFLIAIISVYFPIAIPAIIFIIAFPFLVKYLPELALISLFLFHMLITQPTDPLVDTGYIKIQDVLLMVMLMLWLTESIVINKAFRTDFSILSKALLFFIITGMVSFIIGFLRNSPSHLLFDDFKEFFYLILFWYVIDKIKNKDQIKRFIVSLIILINLFSIYSFLMKFLYRSSFSETQELRFVVATSVYLSIGIILTLSLWLYNPKPYYKILLVISLILPAAALFLSFTRGHWLACMVGILFVFLFSRSEKQGRAIFVLAGLGIVALVLLTFLTGFSISTLWGGISKRGGESLGIDISLAMRIQEIGLIIREFPNHPVFGHGLGATLFMFRPFRGWVHWWDIHNNYFEFLYEMGLVGVVAYFFWVYAFFKRCHQVFKNITDKYFEALILGFAGTYVYLMVVSLTSGFIFRIDTIPYIAVMMGLVIAIDRLDTEAKTSNAK